MRLLGAGAIFVLLVHALLCLNAQVRDESATDLSQPELSAPLTLRCCENVDGNFLAECIDQATYLNRVLRAAADEKPAVTMYTYVTDSITKYSSYATAINAVYAEQNRYNFHILGRQAQMKSAGYDVKPDPYAGALDARWNKVHILLQALEQQQDGMDQNYGTVDNDELTPASQYVAWVDADLVILDMGMRIELIGQEYPDADIIMSRDLVHAEFVSNSGFIIARCTDWSIAFFKKWWNTYDRTKCCDQNAFTWLYDKFNQENLGHVKLLKTDAINSNFPAWRNQKLYNQVLHLAGASSLYRIPLFRTGFEEVCRAGYEQNKIIHKKDHSNDHPVLILFEQWSSYETARLRPQLVLTPQLLLEHIFHLGQSRISSLKYLNDLKEDKHVIALSPRPITGAIFSGIVPVQFGHMHDRGHQDDSANRAKIQDLPVENRTLHALTDMDLDTMLNMWSKEVQTSMNYVQECQATLNDVLKIDHDESWAAMDELRNKQAENMGHELPIHVEKRLLSGIRAWLLGNFRSVALDLVEVLDVVGERESVFNGFAEKNSTQEHLQKMLEMMSGMLFNTVLPTSQSRDQGAPAVTLLGVQEQPGGESVDDQMDVMTNTGTAATTGKAELLVQIRKMALETLKEAISRAFELFLTIENDETAYSIDMQRFILRDVGTNLLPPMGRLAPPSLQAKVLYYKFKQKQLLAATFTNNLASNTQTDQNALELGIAELQQAMQHWRDMSKLNYYGSDYVMADPYKEGSDVLSSLGTLQCMIRKQDDGIKSLTECAELQDRTLEGYASIRIATRKDIVEGQLQLVETLLSLGICCMDRYQMKAAQDGSNSGVQRRIGGSDGDGTKLGGGSGSGKSSSGSGSSSSSSSTGTDSGIQDLGNALLYFKRSASILEAINTYNDNMRGTTDSLSERVTKFQMNTMVLLKAEQRKGHKVAKSKSIHGDLSLADIAMHADGTPIQDAKRNLCIKDSCRKVAAGVGVAGMPIGLGGLTEMGIGHFMVDGFKKGVRYTITEQGMREVTKADNSDIPVLVVPDNEPLNGVAGYRRVVQVAGKMQVQGSPLQVVLDTPGGKGSAYPNGGPPAAAIHGTGAAANSAARVSANAKGAVAAGAPIGGAGPGGAQTPGGTNVPPAAAGGLASKIVYRKKKLTNRVGETFNNRNSK